MDEMRLYRSKAKLLSQIGMAICLMVLCPLLAGGSERPVTQYMAGWGGAFLFGVGAVVLVRDYLRHEPALILDAHGVSGPLLDIVRFIPWRAIRAVAVVDRRKRGVAIAFDENRMSAAERAEIVPRRPARDRDGYMLAQIKVADLSLKADQLAELLSRNLRDSKHA